MSRTSRQYKGKKYPDKASKSCLNHGGCPICEGNRLHKHRKKEIDE